MIRWIGYDIVEVLFLYILVKNDDFMFFIFEIYSVENVLK